MAGNSNTKKAAEQEPASDPGATLESPPPARVATAQYSDGTGWEVGQAAPEDRYVEVGPDGAPVKGAKATKVPPKGRYARQVAIKGDTVTADMRRSLGLDK